MNKKYLYKTIIGVFFITICNISSLGQKVDSTTIFQATDSIIPKNDLLEFPMKDLANMRVTVASKKEEKISDAPSSITAYSNKDIENLGYYTLADLASITSGYNVTYQYGETGFVTRGQTAGGFNNNKHLLLIDGIPVNFARSYKAQDQEELPLFFAQRVEFLKGPASALYGVSAFYGAISVISKDPLTNGTTAESKLTGGTWDRNIRFMGNILHRSNHGISSLNAGYFHKNASVNYIGNENNSNYLYWDKNTSFFLKASHKINYGVFNGLTFGVIFMYRNGGLGESWLGNNTSSSFNNITWSTLIPYLKFQKQLNKKLIFNSYVKGNNSIEEGQYLLDNSTKKKQNILADPIDGISYYKSNVVNAEALAELRYELNTRTSFILGANYDRRVEEGNPNSHAYHILSPDSLNYSFKDTLWYDFRKRSFYFNTISEYFQIQKNIAFLSGLIITGGLRYDLGIIGSFHYQHVSPRIAIVQKISPKLNLKMMTGQALRAPSIKELDLTNQFLDEVHKIKPDTLINLNPLKAEVIQTYETGLNYNTHSFVASATFFYNTTVNEITSTTLYVPTDKGDTLRGNWILNHTGKTTSKGFELDLIGFINKNIKIFSNYTYALARDSSNNYVAGIPYSQLNGGFMVNLTGKYKFKGSLIAKHIDGYLKDGKTRKLSRGYTFIDMNTIFPVSDNIQIEIQIRNILNQHIKFPPTGIPLPGRTFWVTLGIRLK